MPRSAIAENDGFQQRRPAQVIDVINLDICFQQFLDNLNVTAIRGTDEPGAIVAIRAMDIRASLEGEPEKLEISFGCSDQIGALLGIILLVDVCSRFD